MEGKQFVDNVLGQCISSDFVMLSTIKDEPRLQSWSVVRCTFLNKDLLIRPKRFFTIIFWVQCDNAECRYPECRYANVIMQSVAILSVIMLSVVAPLCSFCNFVVVEERKRERRCHMFSLLLILRDFLVPLTMKINLQNFLQLLCSCLFPTFWETRDQSIKLLRP